MKIDTILHLLLPRENKFFAFFEKDVENLLETAQTLKDLMSDSVTKKERAEKIQRIVDLEHVGDETTHQILSALGSTFITPFDREDIHELATKIDDIVDYLQGAATRLMLYRVQKISPEMQQLAVLIHQQVIELHRSLPRLQNLKNATSIRDSLVRINSIENEADDLFERAIARLFETCKDPIRLIKEKELLVSLETATDQCEDAANVIESILVKNA